MNRPTQDAPAVDAVGARFERGFMALVEKRAGVSVLQKRSCAVWLLCYSNHINNAPESSMSKWTFYIEGLNIERSYTCPTSNQARMFIWESLTDEQRDRVVCFDLIDEEVLA